MLYRTIIGWAIASLCLLTLPAWAVQYRLQVTNLDRQIFASYLDRSYAGPRGEDTMQGLETRLDSMEFPPGAVLPSRELQLLEDPAYGGQVPNRLAFLPPTGKQSWTTAVWEGTPGTRVAFVVKSEMAAWQEVWDIAANAGGVLRRLTLGTRSLFGGQSRQVPAIFRDSIATAADQGTYVAWLQQHAKPIGGMSMVVGRRNDVFTSADRVYMLLTLPTDPRTFKVVIGWKDYDDRGTGGKIIEQMRWQP